MVEKEGEEAIKERASGFQDKQTTITHCSVDGFQMTYYFEGVTLAHYYCQCYVILVETTQAQKNNNKHLDKDYTSEKSARSMSLCVVSVFIMNFISKFPAANQTTQ